MPLPPKPSNLPGATAPAPSTSSATAARPTSLLPPKPTGLPERPPLAWGNGKSAPVEREEGEEPDDPLPPPRRSGPGRGGGGGRGPGRRGRSPSFDRDERPFYARGGPPGGGGGGRYDDRDWDRMGGPLPRGRPWSRSPSPSRSFRSGRSWSRSRSRSPPPPVRRGPPPGYGARSRDYSRSPQFSRRRMSRSPPPYARRSFSRSPSPPRGYRGGRGPPSPEFLRRRSRSPPPRGYPTRGRSISRSPPPRERDYSPPPSRRRSSGVGGYRPRSISRSPPPHLPPPSHAPFTRAAPKRSARDYENDGAEDDMIFRKAKRSSRAGSIVSASSFRGFPPRPTASNTMEDDYPYGDAGAGSGPRRPSRSPMSPSPPPRNRSPSPLYPVRRRSPSPPPRALSPRPLPSGPSGVSSLPSIPTGPRAFRGGNSIPFSGDVALPSPVPTGSRGVRGGGLPSRPLGAAGGLPARPPSGPSSSGLPAIPTGPKAWRTTQTTSSAPFPGAPSLPSAPSRGPPVVVTDGRSETPPPSAPAPAPPKLLTDAEIAALTLERERLAVERLAAEADAAAARAAREEQVAKEREERQKVVEVRQRTAKLARFLPRQVGGMLANVQGVTGGMMLSPGTEFEAEIIRLRRDRLPLYAIHNAQLLSTLSVDTALKNVLADAAVAKERTALARGEGVGAVGGVGEVAMEVGLSGGY
ncbi:hypothetical protein JCM8547_008741 [Rhodosporidiobolus lusitaniae]